MSDLEKKLEHAAQEVRDAARHSTPPPIESRTPAAHRAWFVFAAGFAVVVIVVGIIPLLAGPTQDDTVAPSTIAVAPTSAVPTVTTTTVAANCSASGMPLAGMQDDLPDAVAATRQAIMAAASTCDYAALEALAPELLTSFGGGGFDNLQIWEEEGIYQPLAILMALFDTPFATQDIEGNPRFYVWPSAFVYDTWDEIPAADLEALAGIYTQEELDQIATFGSYAGWRIGITEDGEWRFFVAGD